MSLRSAFLLALSFCILGSVSGAFAQAELPLPKENKPALPAKATPKPTPLKVDVKNLTAEQAAEFALLAYGGLGGRATLNQIRKTTFESGVSNVVNTEGRLERATYQRRIIRADSLGKERIRLDQDFPGARFAMVQADEKIFGIFNNGAFAPRPDLVKTFENQIYRGLDGLLRYQENGSKLELSSHEKVAGVDFYIVEVTDKQDRKTKYYISTKTFRIMMLEYEDGGIKYRRKFYDYNYAQGTLFPYRTVLWAGDKMVEETDVGTITFGQKVDEDLFKAS